MLFVSRMLIAGDLAYRLKNEGCDVKLYIEDKGRKDCFDGMIEKTNDWKKELKWVGKDGLIVFDDVGYGKIQDDLRKKGYSVFGGNIEGDKLEMKREYSQKIFASCGINVEKPKDFNNIKSAITYIKKHKAKWVVKKNNHDDFFSYIGVLEDGSDVISFLEKYKNKISSVISLQKKVEGVEVDVARYFNGNDWTSPILISFEHKPLMNNDIGPLTPEMGTLAWYDENENNKFFLATLAKLKPYLQKIDYRGYVDINSIFNKNGVFPIEATMRLAYPTNQLQSEMHLSPWKKLLMKTAKGESYNLRCKKSFSLVVLVAVPPFPYRSNFTEYCLKGVKIFFKNKLKKEELNRIHFDEVSLKKTNEGNKYYISSENGFVCCVTGSGKSVQEAREKTHALVDKIVIPKMFYRTDIGLKFIERDKKLLKKWMWM